MALKTWHKVALSTLAIGVTLTSIYYGKKAFKRYMAGRNKPAPTPEVKADTKVEDKAPTNTTTEIKKE